MGVNLMSANSGELLDPGAVEGFTDVEVSVGVHRDRVSGDDVSGVVVICNDLT